MCVSRAFGVVPCVRSALITARTQTKQKERRRLGSFSHHFFVFGHCCPCCPSSLPIMSTIRTTSYPRGVAGQTPTRVRRTAVAAVRASAGGKEEQQGQQPARRHFLVAGAAALVAAVGVGPMARPAAAFIEPPPGMREGERARELMDGGARRAFHRPKNLATARSTSPATLPVTSHIQGFRLHEDRLDGYYFFYPADWLTVTVWWRNGERRNRTRHTPVSATSHLISIPFLSFLCPDLRQRRLLPPPA